MKVMDKKKLLLTLCIKLNDQRSAAKIIIENIDNLTNEDIDFLLWRIQWAFTQVKHDNWISSMNQMNNILQSLKSQELEIAIKENSKVKDLLDRIDC